MDELVPNFCVCYKNAHCSASWYLLIHGKLQKEILSILVPWPCWMPCTETKQFHNAAWNLHCAVTLYFVLMTGCTKWKKKKKKKHDNQNSTKCCIQFLANPWILTCSTRGGPLASRSGGKHQPCCMPASLTFFFFFWTVTSLASMANSLLTYKWTTKLQSVCAVKFRQYSDNTQHG